ncbi:MAG: dihydropteroate synthase [Chloroflexi bacterium]|nr:dihydropteroate synthase [Chloroflexota bacterium]
MQIIASNLSFRDPKVAKALRHRQGEPLREIAQKCVAAGAQILDINLGTSNRYGPEVMNFVVGSVQEMADVQLCLSSDNADTLEAGIQACRRPPIINYVAIQTEELEKILPLAAKYETELVLLTADNALPIDSQECLRLAAVLVGAANELGIPNHRLIIDPGVLHITADPGPSHALAIMELLHAIPQTFDPPVRTTCWISNVSAGAPRRLRPAINGVFLAMLAGLGLSSAFIDVLDKEVMRTVRLIKIMRNELIYSDYEAELR